MALTCLQLHHRAVRMRPDAAAETLTFYRDVLGLTPDEGAREVPGIPLFWMSTEDGAQVHVFAGERLLPRLPVVLRHPFDPDDVHYRTLLGAHPEQRDAGDLTGPLVRRQSQHVPVERECLGCRVRPHSDGAMMQLQTSQRHFTTLV